MKNYRKIKSLMVLHGISSKSIAEKAGVSFITVSVVLTGKRRSRNVETTIADSLGIPWQKLWPANGKRGRPAAA